MKLASWAALAVVLVAPGLTGCLPVVAGGLIYDNVANNENRAKFQTEFNKQNMDREKEGLKPLDWCSEAYKAHPAWAKDDKPCAERIKRYESGEHSALVI